MNLTPLDMKKTILFAACLLAGGGACAECSRDDVNYFLEKGFNRDQVAAICGGDSAPGARPGAANEYEGYGDSRRQQSRSEMLQQERQQDISLLQAAVSAWDVEVAPKHLTYTRKLCLGAGGSPEVAARVRICPEVRYRVYFKGLKVKGYQREYVLVGRREIEVEGKVKRKLLHDFEEYQPDIRRQLMGSYRARTRKDGTVIPIRKDYPMQRVYQVLRGYAARASRDPS